MASALSRTEIEEATRAAKSILANWSEASALSQGTTPAIAESRQISRLGQYEILGNLGAGGFGNVYKAKDTHLDEIVAIKELRLDDPSALREEAKVLSKLRHENIVGFRQLFTDGDRWYLVIDFVEGGSLATLIAGKRLYEGARQKALERMIA